jgi:TolB-like protein/class 3 adenylate cyclase/cytochrome c-type biogenesis protein CcmH/NrfG
MAETRKIAAILAADVVGFSRMASQDEDRTLARLRALRADVIDPIIAAQNGRVFKRTGDGALVEFRSVVEAVRSAISVQNAMAERNVGMPEDQRIVFRIGIHLGDVVEEADGDLMGDGVNIAARLEGMSEPGGICLSEDAYRHARDRVNEKFADLGERALKNIARPVRAFGWVQEGSVGSSGPVRSAIAPEETGPPRLSIVVLPFANLGGDASQDYFVDGVTESLTTDLSRISGSFVMARNTAFSYKGKAVDAKQIGRELNLRYVLGGSIQRGGERMRVNVQLIEAESGRHLWADRFDKPIADLFEMQDEIVARLANALNAQLVAAEARRADRTPNPDSLDLCFQGLAYVNKNVSPQSLMHARDRFERALALDDNNVEALVGIGMVHAFVTATNTSTPENRASFTAKAEVVLARALALAPDHGSAHLWLGVILLYDDRAAEAISRFERALELSPSMAVAHGFIGRAKLFLSHPEETEGHVREALRLSPKDTMVFAWNAYIGYAKAYMTEYREAVTWLRRSIEANRTNPPTYFYLAAALAKLGQTAEARATMGNLFSLVPDWTVSHARANAFAFSSNPEWRAFIDRLHGYLREAGVLDE